MWQTPSGACDGACNPVRKMYSASCQDRLFVAWTAHTGWVQNAQYFASSGLYDETTVMHISEYTIDASTSAATLVTDKEISYCFEAGEIYAAPDCSVVGALCRSSAEAATIGDVATMS